MTIRNPAALAALAQGDLDNFAVAATPGGIEAQEAAGQAMLCAAAQLPKEMHGVTREQLEAIGFKFGANVDELFVSCTLPAGWKKKATEHAMHSDLLDDKGRVRAGIFYKAAFYDRRADLHMTPRFRVSTYGSSDEAGNAVEDRDSGYSRVVIEDCGKSAHLVGVYKARDYKALEPLERQAEAWLAEHYPDHRNSLAYWG